MPGFGSTPQAVWAVPCALGAAAAFGVANVAQMRAARRVDVHEGIDPRLLVRLLGDRLWLLGMVTSGVGFLLQATALYLAPVVLVQPLIVTELLFALPLAAALAGARLRLREWAGIGLVAGGLALLMLGARPAGTRTTAPGPTWAVVTLAVAAAVLALAALGERLRHRVLARASALALAAGTCFGLTSVLTRSVSHQFADVGMRAVLHPQPWLLGVVAVTGLLLAQTAFRIAPLSVSLPLIDLGEPLIGSLLAVVVFGDRLGRGPGVAAAVVAAGLLVAAGVTLLDTSPLVRAAQHRLATAPDVGPVIALPPDRPVARERAAVREQEPRR